MLSTIFGVTLTWTSSLSHPRISVPGAYISKFRVLMQFDVVDWNVLFWDYCDLYLLLTSFKKCAEHISYIIRHRNPKLGYILG